MKKNLVLSLALMLCFVSFAVFADETKMEGNVYLSGLPIVKEKEELRIFILQPENAPSGFEGIAQVERFENETNIDIIWETIPGSAWNEQKSIMIASDDLPDVIAGGSVSNDELITWGQLGLLVELTPYLEYMPNFQKIIADHPEYLEQLKLPDGSIYSFGTTADIDFGQRGNLMYVNDDWLKAAGLDYPVEEKALHSVINYDMSIDEFTNMLYKFKEIAPEGGYALNGTYDGFSAFSEMYGMFGRVDNSKHIVVEDGKVVFTATQDEWKNAVNYFAKLYADGIIDPEYFTQDYSTYLAKSSQEMPLFGMGIVWTAHQYDNSMGERYDDWHLLRPIADENGNRTWMRQYSAIATGTYCITSACENVLTAIRFQDYLYEEDNAMQLSMGEFGTSLIKNEDGTYDMLAFVTDTITGLNMCFLGTPEAYAKVKFAEPTQMTIDVGMEYRKYQPEVPQVYPVIAFTSEAQEELSELQTNIQTYVAQMQASWITNGGIDEGEWTDYLAQLNAMGLERYIQIHQENLDK
jgi:putative aldouronate transport system substrate-binding protein